MKLDSKILSEYRIAIFGFAALWIFMRHTIHCGDFTYIQPMYWFFQFGDAGVDIFLFLSGYGLTLSLEKSKSITTFYKKRFRRLAPILPNVLRRNYFIGQGLANDKSYTSVQNFVL